MVDLMTYEGENLQGQPWQVYPRPQMRRDSFLNLNGQWDFAVPDFNLPPETYDKSIRVPFCPECRLSGIGEHFPERSPLFYRRTFTVPEEFHKGRVLLHIGAADQVAQVYVNGQFLASHKGGYEAFSVDITNALKAEKAGTKAVKLLEDNVKLMERLGNSVRVEADLPKAEKRIMQMLLETKRSVKDLEAGLKELYSLTLKDLPELWYPDKSKAAPCVLAWLLTAHETTFTHPWNQKDVVAEYKQAGICPQAKEILEELNPARVQRAMLALACANLGITGRSKKMYLMRLKN